MGIVFLCTGMSQHMNGEFNHFAKEYAKAGFVAVGYDHRGKI